MNLSSCLRHSRKHREKVYLLASFRAYRRLLARHIGFV